MKKVILALMAALMVLPFSVAAKKRKPADINVISYNIRVGTAKDGTNSWEYRYPVSAMMIMDQKPDIFGLQEALDFQFKYLEEYCPDYKGVGVGREAFLKHERQGRPAHEEGEVGDVVDLVEGQDVQLLLGGQLERRLPGPERGRGAVGE